MPVTGDRKLAARQQPSLWLIDEEAGVPLFTEPNAGGFIQTTAECGDIFEAQLVSAGSSWAELVPQEAARALERDATACVEERLFLDTSTGVSPVGGRASAGRASKLWFLRSALTDVLHRESPPVKALAPVDQLKRMTTFNSRKVEAAPPMRALVYICRASSPSLRAASGLFEPWPLHYLRPAAAVLLLGSLSDRRSSAGRGRRRRSVTRRSRS